AFPGLGFSLGYRYRSPVIILADAFLGQLKEDIEFPAIPREKPETPWATTGARGAERHVVASLHLDFADQSAHAEHLMEKFGKIEGAEQRYEAYETDDADVVLVAYGISSRLCRHAVNVLRSGGVRAGLLRPITLWPFPAEGVRKLLEKGVDRFVVVELNNGQMFQDVKLAVEGRATVGYVRKLGGLLPGSAEVVSRVEAMAP
ncbi:MAG TPA: transketolase C-terminal domain-containing protein, partial [Nitrososphaerales archaeon]|nr:transketolase C-terminal domain-containing protein [Nitrososphaerales archaeon]